MYLIKNTYQFFLIETFWFSYTLIILLSEDNLPTEIVKNKCYPTIAIFSFKILIIPLTTMILDV